MSRGIQVWSEEAIAAYQREGRGRGKGQTYQPWVRVIEMYSDGRSHEPYSHLTGRSHQLLSDAEFYAFLMLEWAHDTADIREQYPYDRELTQALAIDLGIKYPCYPGTHIPIVMTLDFLVNRVREGSEDAVGISVKTAEALNDPEVVELLELERATCQVMGMPFHLLVKERMPQQKIFNLEWIRDAQLDRDGAEPFPGFYEDHKARMLDDIVSGRPTSRLVDYCSDYDRRFSCRSGTGMRVARMLLQSRSLTMDLNNKEPQLARVDSFKLSALPGRLRAVGEN